MANAAVIPMVHMTTDIGQAKSTRGILHSGVFLANDFREFCILLTISAFQIELSRPISSKDVDGKCISARYVPFHFYRV